MKIDLPKSSWKAALNAIDKFAMMNFPEITDGNKQSEIYGAMSDLQDFWDEVYEQIEDMGETEGFEI